MEVKILGETGVVLGRTQGREAWEGLDLAELAQHLSYEITTKNGS